MIKNILWDWRKSFTYVWCIRKVISLSLQRFPKSHYIQWWICPAIDKRGRIFWIEMKWKIHVSLFNCKNWCFKKRIMEISILCICASQRPSDLTEFSVKSVSRISAVLYCSWCLLSIKLWRYRKMVNCEFVFAVVVKTKEHIIKL